MHGTAWHSMAQRGTAWHRTAGMLDGDAKCARPQPKLGNPTPFTRYDHIIDNMNFPLYSSCIVGVQLLESQWSLL